MVAWFSSRRSYFTRQLEDLLPDLEFAKFQQFLTDHPDSGDVIQGTGGLRKIRWAVPGRGKRGGVRVIYFHVNAEAQIRLLLIYAKGVKDDLTVAEKKTLRALNEHW